MQIKMKKLNLGCGRNKKKGYINIDILKRYNPDKIINLDKFPWPFKDNSIDEVYLSHVLEHMVDSNKVMQEIHRILKSKGKAVIVVPYFTSIFAFRDPTHKHFFTHKTFDYYLKNYKNLHYFNFEFSKIIYRKIIFGKKIQVWNYILEPLFNLFPKIYENTFLRGFPAMELKVILVK
jgi:SAM-dependent methyltransferase